MELWGAFVMIVLCAFGVWGIAELNVWIIGAVILGFMPVLCLIAIFTLPLAIKAIQGSFKSEDMGKLMPAMTNNVMVVLLTQLLTGGGYILSGVFKV